MPVLAMAGTAFCFLILGVVSSRYYHLFLWLLVFRVVRFQSLSLCQSSDAELFSAVDMMKFYVANLGHIILDYR